MSNIFPSHLHVCRSYTRQAQPVTSSRRNSPVQQPQLAQGKGNKRDNNQLQDTTDTEKSLSDITKKHLAQIISTMIPLTHSTLTEGRISSNDNTTQNEENVQETHKKAERNEDKQVIVNNFYIPNMAREAGNAHINGRDPAS